LRINKEKEKKTKNKNKNKEIIEYFTVTLGLLRVRTAAII